MMLLDFFKRRKKQNRHEIEMHEAEKLFQQMVLEQKKQRRSLTEIRESNYPTYDLEYIKAFECKKKAYGVDAQEVEYDISMKQWRLRAQLDEEHYYYLSVFLDEQGSVQNFSLDVETAHDSHYEFQDEVAIRWRMYQPGDEHKYLHEIFSCYIKKFGGIALYQVLTPFILAEFRYD